MARAKEALPEAPFVFDEEYAQLAAHMRELHVSRISDMPRIPLYLDQVLSIVGTELEFMGDPDEKLVTGAMVNNYVKLRIVPAPVRKRYTRRHIATLIFVCAFKRVLSISQIKHVFEIARAADVDVERAYDELIGVFERDLAELFPEDPEARPELSMPDLHLVDSAGIRCDASLERLLEKVTLLLACKVHADRMLALEAQRGFEQA